MGLVAQGVDVVQQSKQALGTFLKFDHTFEAIRPESLRLGELNDLIYPAADAVQVLSIDQSLESSAFQAHGSRSQTVLGSGGGSVPS